MKKVLLGLAVVSSIAMAERGNKPLFKNRDRYLWKI